jgi:hypothetical protein
MKAAILLTPLILLSACSKEEAPSPAAVSTKPAADERSKTMVPGRRNVTPLPAGAAQPAAPLAPADLKAIEGFSAKAEALVQEWEAFKALPDDQQTEEGAKQIREKYMALAKERGKLMGGMTLEQRREHGRTILGSMSKIGSGLTTWQLSRGRRNIIPPTARRPEAAGQGTTPKDTAPVPQEVQPGPADSTLGEGTPDPSPAADPTEPAAPQQ